jgi:hypothetical protein
VSSSTPGFLAILSAVWPGTLHFVTGTLIEGHIRCFCGHYYWDPVRTEISAAGQEFPSVRLWLIARTDPEWTARWANLSAAGSHRPVICPSLVKLAGGSLHQLGQ